MDNARVFFFARFSFEALVAENSASFPSGREVKLKRLSSSIPSNAEIPPPYRERSFASTSPSSAFPLATTSARTPMSVAVCSARLSRHSPGTTRHVGASRRVCSASSSVSTVSTVSILARVTNGDTRRGRSSTPCRCVANMPRAPAASSASMTAPPMAVPCAASVPRPSSSMNTSDLGVTTSSIVLTSAISTAYDERPSAGESVLDIRATRLSKCGTTAVSAGTNRPQFDRSAAHAVARRTVLFPAMFGPVNTMTPETVTSFGTAEPSRGIQNGVKRFIVQGVVTSSSSSKVEECHPRFSACFACSDTAVAMAENVAAAIKSDTWSSSASASALSADDTAPPARTAATR